ncbi:hypothetical protein SAMD00023353_3900910 [Rosellinia necatrix]|uniref:Uncharacterized protein n=1 Tax=Rosellinia necatrix TaxID=77044 RepID=A0A1S7UNP8_ROSNE|nr:hypothetical protein SAMD00023353_3900910 [Rosellinia necatrix]
MADPISLGLGIAPLALSAIKIIKATRSKLKVLRSHDKVLQRLRRSFKTQSHVFLDECHLLLQEIVNPDDVVFMLEDEESELWADPDLDQKIKRYLGRKYESIEETLGEIRRQIQALDKRLNYTLQDTDRDVKLTATEKFREAVSVTTNKTSYEADIGHIKELNQEFRRLRKMAKEFNQSNIVAQAEEQKLIPADYSVKGELARAFYNSVKSCWSCAEVHHAEHRIALLLEWFDGHDMRIFLHCRHRIGITTSTHSLDLTIQPPRLPLGETRALAMNLSTAIPCTELPHTNNFKPSRDDQLAEHPLAKRLRQVSRIGEPLTVSSENTPEPQKSVDLQTSNNVCGTLFQLAEENQASTPFLGADCLRRRALFPGNHVGGAVSKSAPKRAAIPLTNILNSSLDADLTVTQQLRLVLQIAKGHLQLHWTPWWQQYWSLWDLSYFKDPSATELSTCLKTMHIGTRLDLGTKEYEMTTAEQPPSGEVLQLTYGIRNLSLYCLGVALLQIGRWSQLDASDVFTIRKLASVNGRLGPRYQELTQKCIDCDFGHGSDLGSPPLQRAFYKSVICELESLVAALERS